MSLSVAYLQCVTSNFEGIKRTGDKTLTQLSIEEMNFTPSSESNSIAIIVKHLNGNMISRWTNFLTSDGEKLTRDRDNEFISGFNCKKSLLYAWEEGWNIVFSTLSSLTADDLLRKVYIRSEEHSVLEAIQRQVVHYTYHIGQMVYIAKQMKDGKWQTLTIPRGKSKEYLEQMTNEGKV